MRFRFLCLLLAVVGCDSESLSMSTMSDAEFRQLHALIRPRPGEDAFDRIPWLTSLGEARKKASAEGKPILLWEMDGHPLGCT